MEDGAILRYSADTELEQLDNEGSVGDGLSSWGKDSISAMQFCKCMSYFAYVAKWESTVYADIICNDKWFCSFTHRVYCKPSSRRC